MAGYQWKGTHKGPDLFDATEPPPKPAEPEIYPQHTRQLKPCGTTAAYTRHKRRGETPCDPCRLALADKIAELRGGRGKRKTGNPRTAECGTRSGTLRHYREGTKPCQACRDAANEYKRRWKEAKRGGMIDDQQAA